MKCKCGNEWDENGVCKMDHVELEEDYGREYTLAKIARRDDAVSERAHVYIGQTVTGSSYGYNKLLEKWEIQDIMYPQIGYPVFVKRVGLSRDFIRTSNVTSWCQLGSDNDKLILPKDFPIEALPEKFNFEEGDILIATLNSIYLAKWRKDLM